MDQMINPLITVIMPVYNAERYLKQAVFSILAQSYSNFEFIIINDGSTDGSAKILDSINDRRIICIHKKNTGISKCLNIGIARAKGVYIARMDADDISLPDRLEKQVNSFLEDRKLILCGGCAYYINEKGDYLGRSFNYSRDYSIKKMLKFGNVIIHPTVMIKKESLLACGRYSENWKSTGEDYDLWKRLQYLGRFKSLQTPLIYYRINKGSVGIANHFKIGESIRENIDYNGLLDKAYLLRIREASCNFENIIFNKSPKVLAKVMAFLIIEIKNIITFLKPCVKFRSVKHI